MWRASGAHEKLLSLAFQALQDITYLVPFSEDSRASSSHSQLSNPFSALSLSFPMYTMGPVPHPQFLPSLCYLSAGNSVILNVVSLENQRLALFWLLWRLLMLVLGMGGMVVPLPLFQGLLPGLEEPWTRGTS